MRIDLSLAMRLMQAEGYQQPVSRVVIFLPETAGSQTIVPGVIEAVYLFDRGQSLPYVAVGAMTGAVKIISSQTSDFQYPPQ